MVHPKVGRELLVAPENARPGDPREREVRIEYMDEDSWGRWEEQSPDAAPFQGNPSIEWYKNYQDGDIFRGAGSNLVTFLHTLEKYPRAEKIRLVQLGDMYDL